MNNINQVWMYADSYHLSLFLKKLPFIDLLPGVIYIYIERERERETFTFCKRYVCQAGLHCLTILEEYDATILGQCFPLCDPY
jgi:hypothetical protein